MSQGSEVADCAVPASPDSQPAACRTATQAPSSILPIVRECKMIISVARGWGVKPEEPGSAGWKPTTTGAADCDRSHVIANNDVLKLPPSSLGAAPHYETGLPTRQ